MIDFTHFIVNGCSFAYAQNIPRTQTWSYIVAEEFGMELSQLAKPGASNATILRTTTDHALQHEGDLNYKPLYCISWTQQERREEYFKSVHHSKGVFEPRGVYQGASPNGYIEPQTVFMPITPQEMEDATVVELAHYECGSPWEAQVFAMHRKYMNWFHAISMLENMGLDFLMSDYFVESNQENSDYFRYYYRNIWNKVEQHESKLKDFDKLTSGYPVLPCGHDGIVSQHILADYVIEEIKKRYIDI